MIGVRLYAAPLPGGLALVAPAAAVADLRDAATLVARYPVAVRLDVLVPAHVAGVAGAEVEAQARQLIWRAAGAAAVPPPPAEVGPRGRWYAALVAWGWLLVLGAAQNWAHVVGGLWLAAGLPLARRAYRASLRAWTARTAAAVHSVVTPAEVRQVEHAGLTRLAAAVQAATAAPADACRAAARLCAPAGLAGLAPFYLALADGALPSGLWTAVPAPPPAGPVVEPAAAAPGVETVGAPADRQ